VIFLPYATAWFKSKGLMLEMTIFYGGIISARLSDRKFTRWTLDHWVSDET
jgi:hypothetical protein